MNEWVSGWLMDERMERWMKMQWVSDWLAFGLEDGGMDEDVEWSVIVYL